jgi:hypothetical protein
MVVARVRKANCGLACQRGWCIRDSPVCRQVAPEDKHPAFSFSPTFLLLRILLQHLFKLLHRHRFAKQVTLAE